MSHKTLAGVIGQNIIVGLLTAAPLAVTWLILDFLLGQLSRIGRPGIEAFARAIERDHPFFASLLLNDTILSTLAIVAILAALCGLGWMTTHVVGQRLIGIVESLIDRIPFVDTIYQAAKRFIRVAHGSPGNESRVVLIDFPSPEMKAIGLITHMLTDKNTGEKLAAVYVPTAPNPTSGYIEIVPMAKLTVTDWTFDQAMSFVITGGANSPPTIAYSGKGETAK